MPRANSTKSSHKWRISSALAPSEAAVAMSSAAHRSSKSESCSRETRSGRRITASAGMAVPATLVRCSYARCRHEWLQYFFGRPRPVASIDFPHQAHEAGFLETASDESEAGNGFTQFTIYEIGQRYTNRVCACVANAGIMAQYCPATTYLWGSSTTFKDSKTHGRSRTPWQPHGRRFLRN